MQSHLMSTESRQQTGQERNCLGFCTLSVFVQLFCSFSDMTVEHVRIMLKKRTLSFLTASTVAICILRIFVISYFCTFDVSDKTLLSLQHV